MKTGIYLTPRERAMQVANKEGYQAFPHGSMPSAYKDPANKHLADAWNGGWQTHRAELGWEDNCR